MARRQVVIVLIEFREIVEMSSLIFPLNGLMVISKRRTKENKTTLKKK